MKLFYSNALLTSTMTSTSVTTGTSGSSSSSGTAPATTTSSSSQSSLANTIITATAGVLAHLPNPNRWTILIYKKSVYVFKVWKFYFLIFFAEPSQQWPIRLTVPRIALRWWKLWLPCLSEEAVGVLLIIPTKIKINLHLRTSASLHNNNSSNSN